MRKYVFLFLFLLFIGQSVNLGLMDSSESIITVDRDNIDDIYDMFDVDNNNFYAREMLYNESNDQYIFLAKNWRDMSYGVYGGHDNCSMYFFDRDFNMISGGKNHTNVVVDENNDVRFEFNCLDSDFSYKIFNGKLYLFFGSMLFEYQEMGDVYWPYMRYIDGNDEVARLKYNGFIWKNITNIPWYDWCTDDDGIKFRCDEEPSFLNQMVFYPNLLFDPIRNQLFQNLNGDTWIFNLDEKRWVLRTPLNSPTESGDGSWIYNENNTKYYRFNSEGVWVYDYEENTYTYDEFELDITKNLGVVFYDARSDKIILINYDFIFAYDTSSLTLTTIMSRGVFYQLYDFYLHYLYFDDYRRGDYLDMNGDAHIFMILGWDIEGTANLISIYFDLKIPEVYDSDDINEITETITNTKVETVTETKTEDNIETVTETKTGGNIETVTETNVNNTNNTSINNNSTEGITISNIEGLNYPSVIMVVIILLIPVFIRRIKI